MLSLASSGAAACGAFGSSDSSGGNDKDAGVTDASMADDGASVSPVDGAAGSNDAGTSPAVDAGDLLNDDLESANVGDTCTASHFNCINCTTAVSNIVGHSGKQSCQVCRANSNWSIHFFTDYAGAGDYTMQMYVTALGDAGVFQVDGAAPTLVTAGYMLNGNNAVGFFPSNGAALVPGKWVLAQTAATVLGDAGVTRVEGYLYATPDQAGDCFYIDDARIYRR